MISWPESSKPDVSLYFFIMLFLSFDRCSWSSNWHKRVALVLCYRTYRCTPWMVDSVPLHVYFTPLILVSILLVDFWTSLKEKNNYLYSSWYGFASKLFSMDNVYRLSNRFMRFYILCYLWHLVKIVYSLVISEIFWMNFWQIVLSGFGSGEQHLKLTTVMFQNIFPAIDVNTVSA